MISVISSTELYEDYWNKTTDRFNVSFPMHPALYHQVDQRDSKKRRKVNRHHFVLWFKFSRQGTAKIHVWIIE